LPARGQTVRAAVGFYVASLAGMSDQSFLGEKLQGSIPLRVNGVLEVAFNGRKHGDNRTHLMVVGCVINLLANREFGHRELLLESWSDYNSINYATLLNYVFNSGFGKFRTTLLL
jgi:hypothetical protein